MVATEACPIMNFDAATDRPGALRRVLLVEDAAFLRYAFGRLLRMHGFEVREATDGREALRDMAESRPDLVLTDSSYFACLVARLTGARLLPVDGETRGAIAGSYKLAKQRSS